MRPLFVTFLACLLSAPLFAILAVTVDLGALDLASVPAASWWALVGWGVGTLGAGSALWYSGIERAEGTTAAGFTSLMALSAFVLGYI